MKLWKPVALAAAVAVVAGGYVAAQVTLPQLPGMGSTDLVQVIPGGQASVGNVYVPLSVMGGGLPFKANALIGGDPTTNLWARGTAGVTITTAVSYQSADRWAAWSGTNTAMKLIRDSTAGDLAPGYQYAFKMQRTSGQTGVVQMCMLQEIESVNSYQFQGSTAELDFHAFPGANFSAASANMTAYIIYGTGTDEGVAGTSSVAFGLNAGGGGSGSWTGQTNATAAVVGLGTTLGRYAVIASIPATATEIAVALCYTPVGTAGTNDYIAFSGIQLTRNPMLSNSVSTTAGFPCSTATGGNGGNLQVACSAFERRSQEVETVLQQRYYWQITEPAASKPVATGNYQTATICDVVLPLPVTMRAVPTITIGGTAESATTWAVMIASTTPVVLASTYLVADAVVGSTVNAVGLQATTASKTAGQGCTLVGAGGGANIQLSAEL